MTPLLYFFCFGLIAIGALWRVISWLHPIDPARSVPWLLLLGDPIAPMLSFYVPSFIGTLGFLLILFLLLKRSLAFLRARAFEVPGSFTRVPSTLAGIGLASAAAMFVLSATPGAWRWKGMTEVWLINLTLFVLPVSFYLTEIRGLVRSAVSPRARTSSGGEAKRSGPRSVFSPPVAPPTWSWLAYGVIWFGVSAMILRRFGGLALYDSTRSPLECLFEFGVAGIPGGLVVALIKIFADPVLIGIAAKRSKIDMAEELLDSVALTAVAVAGEGALNAAAGAASGGASGDEGFGGGSSGGGGASGTI